MNVYDKDKKKIHQIDPVSYTHLDVYKRQAKFCFVFERACACMFVPTPGNA